MMLVPEAWENHPSMSEEQKAFYEFHEHLMEPWDGPAALAFTDGIQIGSILDRNGLRPARYVVTKDDRVIMASEVGAIEIPEEDIDLFIVDGKFNTRNHKVIDWLCTKIENGQTNLILDIQEFEED